MKLWFAVLLFFPIFTSAEDFEFDVSSYKKKPFEWGGYLQLTGEYLRLNTDAAFYNLN